MYTYPNIHRLHGGAAIGAAPVHPAIGFGAVGVGAVSTGSVPAVSNSGGLNPAFFMPFYSTPNTVITQNPYYHHGPAPYQPYPFFPYY